MLSDRCHWKIFSTEYHNQDFDLGKKKKKETNEAHAQAELLNQALQMWIREHLWSLVGVTECLAEVFLSII